MNDNAKKWVAALRSDKYPQAKRVLHNDEGFCCLGVACVLYQEEVGDLTVDSPSDPPPAQADNNMRMYDGNPVVLPAKVMAWLGLNTSNGGYRIVPPSNGVIGYETSALSEQNDAGVSFLGIADIIESEPQELFR